MRRGHDELSGGSILVSLVQSKACNIRRSLLLRGRDLLPGSDLDSRGFGIVPSPRPVVVVGGTRGTCCGSERFADEHVFFSFLIYVWVVDDFLLAS